MQRHSLPRLPSPLARRGPVVLRLELLQPPRALERARAHRARLARRGIGVEDRLTAASLAQAGYFLLAAALLLVALLPVKHLALAAAVELLSAGAAAAQSLFGASFRRGLVAHGARALRLLLLPRVARLAERLSGPAAFKRLDQRHRSADVASHPAVYLLRVGSATALLACALEELGRRRAQRAKLDGKGCDHRSSTLAQPAHGRHGGVNSALRIRTSGRHRKHAGEARQAPGHADVNGGLWHLGAPQILEQRLSNNRGRPLPRRAQRQRGFALSELDSILARALLLPDHVVSPDADVGQCPVARGRVLERHVLEPGDHEAHELVGGVPAHVGSVSIAWHEHQPPTAALYKIACRPLEQLREHIRVGQLPDVDLLWVGHMKHGASSCIRPGVQRRIWRHAPGRGSPGRSRPRGAGGAACPTRGQHARPGPGCVELRRRMGASIARRKRDKLVRENGGRHETILLHPPRQVFLHVLRAGRALLVCERTLDYESGTIQRHRPRHAEIKRRARCACAA
mmetsp:Transcript_12843/g.39992  ORF Transcript_12843/g.39992 Transcript_12843/m.39992 type:complete len:515 (+) Transcript_12843:234-1778(+)